MKKSFISAKLFSFSLSFLHLCSNYNHITSAITCTVNNTVNTMKAGSFLPSGHSAPACGCPGKALWLAPDHGWVFWQFPPSPGQRAAGIHHHSAPRPLAAPDHSTPPGHSSSCVCVSWETQHEGTKGQSLVVVVGNLVTRYMGHRRIWSIQSGTVIGCRCLPRNVFYGIHNDFLLAANVLYWLLKYFLLFILITIWVFFSDFLPSSFGEFQFIVNGRETEEPNALKTHLCASLFFAIFQDFRILHVLRMNYSLISLSLYIFNQ